MNTMLNAIVFIVNELAVGVCRYGLAMLFQTAVLVALLLAIDFSLRRRVRAVFRYWMWMLVLVKLMLPPDMSLPTGIGYWCAGMWPASLSSRLASPMNDVPVAASEIAPIPESFSTAGQPGPLAQLPPVYDGQLPVGSLQADTPSSLAAPLVQASASVSSPRPVATLSWAGWLFCAWLAGVITLATYTLCRVVTVCRLVGRTALPDAGLIALFEDCRRHTGLCRQVALRLCRELTSPAVCGILRPVVLLPNELASELSAQQLRAVLLHELAHVARGDLAVHAVQTILQILHFCNPFVWAANAMIRRVREQAVDETVLVALGREPSDYSNTLLDVAAMAMRRRGVSLGLLGVVESRSALATRIRRILSHPVPRSTRLGVSGIVAVLMLAAVAIPMAGGAAKRSPAGVPSAKGVSEPSAGPRAEVASPASRPASTEPSFKPRGILSGRITDERGKPVTDAKIQLDNGREYHKATTDEDGVYGFGDINEAGRFFMFIRSRGWVGTRLAQDRPGVDLDPDKQTVKHLQLKRACQIDIEVIDEQDNPIKGAHLDLLQVGDYLAMNQVETSVTPENGIGRLGGIPASTTPYFVTIMHEKYAPNHVTVTLKEPDRIPRERITLAKGVEVRGRAICSDGKPAAGWELSAQPDWWHSGHSFQGPRIDRDGYFKLRHIVPGTYNLLVGIPQGGGMTSNVVVGQVKLPPNGDLLEVKVPQPSPASMVEISGPIKFTGGKPTQGIEVYARSEKNEHFFANVDSRDREFHIGPLPPGIYELRFSSAEFDEKVIPNVKAPTDDLKVEISYRGKPVIKAQVVDAATGKPITTFRARVRKLSTLRGPNYVGDLAWHEYENTEGKFQVDVMGPGVYEVQVAVKGFAWLCSRQINTDKDKDLVRIALTPGQTLTGRVVDEAGRPVSSAKVIALSRVAGPLHDGAGRFCSEEGAAITSDGSFKFENLAPGRETFKIVHPDYCFAIVKDVQIKDDVAPAPITVTLNAGGTLVGRVTDAGGKPAPIVTLHFQDEYGYQGMEGERAGRLATATTDANGNYEVHHLPEQLCFIRRASDSPFLGVAQMAVLPKNGEKRTANLGGSPCVKGRLVIDGEPLAKASVAICGDNPHFGTFRATGATDQNGAFTIFGVPPGRRTLYYSPKDNQRDWVEVSQVEMASKDVDLGVVSPVSGTVTVTIEGKTPPGLVVHLSPYRPTVFFGGQAGQQRLRQKPTDPFVFENVRPGEYEIAVHRQNHPGLLQRIELKPGQQNASVAIRLRDGSAVIRGKIVGDAGKAYIPLLFLNRDTGVIADLAVDPKTPADYRVEHLPPGKYQLCNASSRTGKALAEVTLKEGETKTLDLDAKTCRLTPGAPGGIGTVDAIAVAEDGRPLPGTEFYLSGPEGRIDPVGPGDLSTQFIGRPGEYTLHASYPGYAEATRNVMLVANVPGSPASTVRTVVTLKRAGGR